MDLQMMIAELEAERDRLDEAILALERLSTANQAKRRARPGDSSLDSDDDSATDSALGADEVSSREANA